MTEKEEHENFGDPVHTHCFVENTSMVHQATEEVASDNFDIPLDCNGDHVVPSLEFPEEEEVQDEIEGSEEKIIIDQYLYMDVDDTPENENDGDMDYDADMPQMEEEEEAQIEREEIEEKGNGNNKKFPVKANKILEFLEGIKLKVGSKVSFDDKAWLRHLKTHAADSLTSREAYTRQLITLKKAGVAMVDFLTHSEILQTANYDVDKVVAHLRQLSYIQYLEVFQDYYKMMLTRKSTRICNQKAMVFGADNERTGFLENSTIISKYNALLLGLECLNVIGVEYETNKSSIYHHILGKNGIRVCNDRQGQKDTYVLQKNGLSIKDIEWLLMNKPPIWNCDGELQSVLVMIMMADMSIRPCTTRPSSKEIDEDNMKPYMGLQLKNLNLIRCPNYINDPPCLVRVRCEISIYRTKRVVFNGTALATAVSVYPRRRANNTDDTTINGAAAVLIMAILRKLVNLDVLSKQSVSTAMSLFREDIDGEEPLILRVGVNGGNLLDFGAVVPAAVLNHGIKKLGLPTPYCFTPRSLRIGFAERRVEELAEVMPDNEILSKEAVLGYLLNTGAWHRTDNAECYLRNVLSHLPDDEKEWTALEWRQALYKASARSRFSNGYKPDTLELLRNNNEDSPQEPKEQQILLNLTNWSKFNNTEPHSYEWTTTLPLDFYSMSQRCFYAKVHEVPFYHLIKFAHPDPMLPTRCPMVKCTFTARTKKESDLHLAQNKGHANSQQECPGCKNVFSCQNALVAHCKSFHHVPAKLLNQTNSIPFFNMIGFAQDDLEVPTLCPVKECTFKTDDAELAVDHWVTHNAPSRFICPCNMNVTFTRKALGTHVGTKHHLAPSLKTKMEFAFFDDFLE